MSRVVTYLGPKGYTLSKASLTPTQERQIKRDLMITPFNLMNQQNMAKGNFSLVKTSAYPVFRETESKLFVPHHYGVKMFGPPSSYQVSPGVAIDVPFVGELRDYQAPVVAKIIGDFAKTPVSGGLLEVPCGWGKTGASMGVISQMRLKTLVIVHKEFLMNQWVERIQQFLPSARVGRIQGSVVDVEEKDIVLCMLQSLVLKPYPLVIFQDFGLTIIDEVHHISSESFSNALFKIKTKHMLGLSATLDRKDGTAYVIEWFLGPVIFKGERAEKFDVLVKSYAFEDSNDEFLETMVDARGNVMYSSMVSKLGCYLPRLEYIANIIRHEFALHPTQQMLVLSTTRAFLEQLHDLLCTGGGDGGFSESELGYYVGGMKEAKLKEAESKRVILGTYAMASEGLDIKTLTSLVLATPKTDIEQSVGRILRMKHGKPLVVDIVDPHAVFIKQWKKRKAFYKKQNYNIQSITFANAFTKEEEEKTTDAAAAAKKKRKCECYQDTEEEKTKTKAKTKAKKETHKITHTETHTEIEQEPEEDEDEEEIQNMEGVSYKREKNK